MQDQPAFETGRLVSLAEVKAMLLAAQQDREDLTYEQKLALEHGLRFSKLPVKDTHALIEDLEKLEFLTDPRYVYKIADMCPIEEEEVRAIFAKSKMTVGETEVGQIIETVLKHYTPED